MRPEPLCILPAAGSAEQLFVLLHGEAAAPDQLLGLAAVIRQAFPQAVIVQPHGPYGVDAHRRWIARPDPQAHDYVTLIEDAGRMLADEVLGWQRHYGLTGQQTAIAGFSEGAAVALAACSVSDLAGRALLFSARFATLPDSAAHETTFHLLHGARDVVAPVTQARQVHARLAELHGDATLDIASGVGHELHEALVHQAVVRLQTCVPLRSWEAAMGAPDLRVDEYSATDGDTAAGDIGDAERDTRSTLH